MKKMKILGKSIETKNLKTINKCLESKSSKIQLSDNAKKIYNFNILNDISSTMNSSLDFTLDFDKLFNKAKEQGLNEDVFINAIMELVRLGLYDLEIKNKYQDGNNYWFQSNFNPKIQKLGDNSDSVDSEINRFNNREEYNVDFENIDWFNSNVTISGKYNTFKKVMDKIYPKSDEWINIDKEAYLLNKRFNKLVEKIKKTYDEELNITHPNLLAGSRQASVLKKIRDKSVTPNDLEALMDNIRKLNK